MIDKKTSDPVSHPSHYTEGRNFEPWDVIIDWDLDYLLGNALKYISRIGRKNSELEDAKKSIQYLKKWIETNYPGEKI